MLKIETNHFVPHKISSSCSNIAQSSLQKQNHILSDTISFSGNEKIEKDTVDDKAFSASKVIKGKFKIAGMLHSLFQATMAVIRFFFGPKAQEIPGEETTQAKEIQFNQRLSMLKPSLDRGMYDLVITEFEKLEKDTAPESYEFQILQKAKPEIYLPAIKAAARSNYELRNYEKACDNLCKLALLNDPYDPDKSMVFSYLPNAAFQLINSPERGKGIKALQTSFTVAENTLMNKLRVISNISNMLISDAERQNNPHSKKMAQQLKGWVQSELMYSSDKPPSEITLPKVMPDNQDPYYSSIVTSFMQATHFEAENADRKSLNASLGVIAKASIYMREHRDMLTPFKSLNMGLMLAISDNKITSYNSPELSEAKEQVIPMSVACLTQGLMMLMSGVSDISHNLFMLTNDPKDQENIKRYQINFALPPFGMMQNDPAYKLDITDPELMSQNDELDPKMKDLLREFEGYDLYNKQSQQDFLLQLRNYSDGTIKNDPTIFKILALATQHKVDNDLIPLIVDNLVEYSTKGNEVAESLLDHIYLFMSMSANFESSEITMKAYEALIKGIGKIASPENQDIKKFLFANLDHPEASISENSIKALLAMGEASEDFRDKLIEKMSDPDQNVAATAVKGLQKIVKHPSTFIARAICQALEDNKESQDNIYLITTLLEALPQFTETPNERQISLCASFTENPEPIIAVIAQETLDKLQQKGT